MKKNLFIFLVLAPLIGISLVGLQVYYLIYVDSYSGEERTFEVRRGEGFSSINYRLSREEIISNPRLFHRYNQFKGQLTRFRSGRFHIKPGMTISDISHTLIYGTPITARVTIPEGYNIFQIAELLENNNVVSAESFLSYARNEEYVRSLGIPSTRVEGYLFPETYFFPEEIDAKEAIEIMHNEFKRQTRNVDFESTQFTPHEVIILASIVEKETGATWERPRIAGVFLNRIEKGMRLQSDPTTIYGMYEGWDGRIRRSDLQRVTPYNTYRINGLPKGPIASPGLAAIMSILEPEEHNYLYFVSRNDGTHVFSKNLRDHNNAVNYWQRNPENRQGRSWRDLDQSPHNPANQPQD